MLILKRLVILVCAFGLAAFSADAQDVNPTVAFDASSNQTTVRVALNVSSDLQLRFNSRFTGRTPTDVAGWIGFAFGNTTESGIHNLTLSVDANPLNFRFPDYSSFQLPRELLTQMITARSVEGAWDGQTFSLSAAHKDGIRRFLASISPANITELDQPRIEHWPLDRTIDYVNLLLSANPLSPCSRSRLAADGGVIHVYIRRCEEDFDNSDMFASASRLQQRGLLYVNGAISLDCAARALCAEVRRRRSAQEDWESTNNTWTWVKIEMGEGSPMAGEKLKNALEHIVMMLKTQEQR